MDIMNLPSKGFGCISDIDEVGNFALLRPLEGRILFWLFPWCEPFYSGAFRRKDGGWVSLFPLPYAW